MILKIYKIKSPYYKNLGNCHFLKNNDDDKRGVFGIKLKSVIREYKETKNYSTFSTLESSIEQNFELIDYKEYNSINELEFDYLEELI